MLEKRELLATFPTLYIPPKGESVSTGTNANPALQTLQEGTIYRLRATGALVIGSGERLADAQNVQLAGTHSYGARQPTPLLEVVGVTPLDASSFDWGNPIDLPGTSYDDRQYTMYVRGTGASLSASFRDSKYDDNAIPSINRLRLEITDVPKITVTAGTPAKETGSLAKNFNIKRTGGDLSKPLDVRFQFEGTATYNDDYTISSTASHWGDATNGFTIRLPANTTTGATISSVAIRVTPKDDFIPEPTEYVKLRILDPGASMVAYIPPSTLAVMGIVNQNHKPTFSRSSYTYYVDPYAKAGAALPSSFEGVPMIATDPDARDTISYSLKPGSKFNSKFNINATTGVITLKANALDPRGIVPDESNRIRVLATDAAGASSETMLNIFRAPRIGIGGVHIAKEGPQQYIIVQLVKLDRSPYAVHVNINLDSAANATSPTFNYKTDFQTSTGTIDIFEKKKVTLPRDTTPSSEDRDAVYKKIYLNPKKDGLKEGIEKFTLKLLVDIVNTKTIGRYVVTKSREHAVSNHKEYWGGAVQQYNIVDGTALYVRGANDGNLPLNNPGIHFNDPDQSKDNNCQWTTTIAAMPFVDYQIIQNAIIPKGDGSYDVILNGTTVNVKAKEVFTDAYYSLDLPGDIDSAGRAEIWPLVLERAFETLPDTAYDTPPEVAQFLNGPQIHSTGSVGISVNHNGTTVHVLDQLSQGKPSLYGTPDDYTGPPPLVYDSEGKTNTLDIYADHMYLAIDSIFADFDGKGIAVYLKLHNPHGAGKEIYIKADDIELRKVFSEMHMLL